MEEKSLIQKLEQFLEDEARTCSMDFGCVTPLYVYRMWGGAVSLEKIEQVMSNIKGELLISLSDTQTSRSWNYWFERALPIVIWPLVGF